MEKRSFASVGETDQIDLSIDPPLAREATLSIKRSNTFSEARAVSIRARVISWSYHPFTIDAIVFRFTFRWQDRNCTFAENKRNGRAHRLMDRTVTF